MKKIQLTQGQFAIVDDEDYEYLNQWKWYANRSRGTKTFYCVRGFDGGLQLMHRLIMRTPEGLQVDHINHNTLDNRKENLRNVTHSQNQMNRSMMSSFSTTGIKGVFLERGKFRVRIRANGKRHHIGYFDTLEEAKVVCEKATENLHGEYRQMNKKLVALETI